MTLNPVPTPEQPASSPLIEPSLADAIATIESAEVLPPDTRRHWACSLRRIAEALDRPLELMPARWTALRIPVLRLHHAPLELTAKTLANHKANLKAALRWYTGEVHLPVRGAPLTPEWARLRDAIADRGLRARLSGLMRYASAKAITPQRVSNSTLAEYLAYRTETTSLAGGVAAERSIARSWNRCVAEIETWPKQTLPEPPLASAQAGPDWEAFPEGLRQDLEAYLDSLGQTRRSANGKRLRPSKASTVRTRRAELVAFTRKAIAIGTPLETLQSLSALLDPDLVERVLDAYWTENGESPKTYTIELAGKLLSVARQTGVLDDLALERLDELRSALEQHRRGGLTDKNLAVIRQVRTGAVWSRVASLPQRLMAEAGTMPHAPVRAALKAQLAVAIALLTVAPVRLGNLVRIRLEDNLIRPAGPLQPYWLVFPDYDVKNRVKLEFPLDESVTELIETYLFEHRPVLLRGANERWLFPGEAGGFKTPNMFSDQITYAAETATGLRLTAHQFRHAAAALILQHDPGNYEFVRRVLGHKTVQTTMTFYVGLETTDANARFGRIVREALTFAGEELRP